MRSLAISVAVGALALAGAVAAHAQSTEASAESIAAPEDLPRLPDYFRQCWEPLPAYCVRPPGLLWFGDGTTLRREHRPRRAHSAVSR